MASLQILFLRLKVATAACVALCFLILPMQTEASEVKIVSVVMDDGGIPFLLDSNGDVWGFRRPFRLENPIKLHTLHHIKKLVPYMALSADGNVYTWKLGKYVNNSNGPDDVGDRENDEVSYTLPQAVIGLSKVSDIASSENHFSAIHEHHQVYEWFTDIYKKHHDKESLTEHPQLVYSNPNADIEEVATSGSSTIILLKDKTIIGWGINNQSQLGSDKRVKIPSDHPATILLPEESSKIFVSRYHTIVLTESGRVFFWGSCLQKNYNEQTTSSVQSVKGGDNVSAVSVNIDDDTFPEVYLKHDGSVWIAPVPLPNDSDQCQIDGNTRHLTERWDQNQPLGGMPIPAITVATGGDGSGTPFTTLALGKNNTVWGANFRHPERGFKKIPLILSNKE
jgi:alpha-tubulin suppressor-like RCC1 family protein